MMMKSWLKPLPIKRLLFIGAPWILIVAVSSGHAWAAAPFMSAGSVSGTPGTSVTFPIDFHAGSPDVASVQFTIIIPPGVSGLSFSAGGFSTCSQSGSNYNCIYFQLITPPVPIVTGTLFNITFQLASNATPGTYPITLTNVVMADTSVVSQSVPPGPSVNGVLTVLGTPQLALTKSVDKPNATSGTTLTYTIQYQNTGTAPATNATISDPVPAGTTLVAGSISSGGTQSGGVITWSLGTVAAGASGNVSFQAKVQ